MLPCGFTVGSSMCRPWCLFVHLQSTTSLASTSIGGFALLHRCLLFHGRVLKESIPKVTEEKVNEDMLRVESNDSSAVYSKLLSYEFQCFKDWGSVLAQAWAALYYMKDPYIRLGKSNDCWCPYIRLLMAAIC